MNPEIKHFDSLLKVTKLEYHKEDLKVFNNTAMELLRNVVNFCETSYKKYNKDLEYEPQDEWIAKMRNKYSPTAIKQYLVSMVESQLSEERLNRDFLDRQRNSAFYSNTELEHLLSQIKIANEYEGIIYILNKTSNWLTQGIILYDRIKLFWMDYANDINFPTLMCKDEADIFNYAVNKRSRKMEEKINNLCPNVEYNKFNA
ncbi:hypothetical protein BNJ_00247 [Kaumoebavirus]|uniref:hypothetical protein n=1 Tax=Kaumoebavirus TaxID=1859492 RepID=UPI0009C1DA2E|nr:hypothetical protein BNJ_00247 [Kaumoebavirus]ARA72075.1 hypothetical protein BNJ_00247 [Kaumoebavirus]